MSTLDEKRKTKNKEPKADWFSWDCVSFPDSRRLETISLLIRANEPLLRFIFDLKRPRLRDDAKILLKEAQKLSSGERLLIQAAIDFWRGEGNTRLSDILRDWDTSNLVSFVRAICHLKSIREEVMHGLIDDEHGGFCL